MSIKIRQRLVLHIGLHKTGTTSFQVACFNSRDTLEKHGILYPDLPLLNGGTKQHVLLVPLLKSTDGCARLIETLRNLGEIRDSKCILLSAEDLSTFLVESNDAPHATAFIDGLNHHFEDWQAYAVVRDGPEMLRSLLLQHIESEGYPGDLREKALAVRKYQRSQCLTLKKVLGDRVTAIDYAELPRPTFSRSLLRKLTGLEVNLPEVRTNISSEKPFASMFSADIRRFWTDFLQAPHPYWGQVNEAVARTMNSLNIEPAEEERLRGALAAKLESVVLEAMSQPESKERLIDFFHSPEQGPNPLPANRFS